MGKRYFLASSHVFSELLGKRVVELLHRNLSVSVVVKRFHERVLLMIRDRNVHAAQTICELIEVNKLVIVFVEFLKEIGNVSLKTGIVAGGGLDFGNNSFDRCLWEDLSVVLHVLFGILVGGGQHKLEAAKEDNATNKEVLLSVVLA